MVVSPQVKQLLKKYYYTKYFDFIKSDGSLQRVTMGATLSKDLNLEASDVIIMNKDILRKIFDYKENEASDIIIHVYNPKEIATVAFKIQQKYPNFQVKTMQDIKNGYEHIFNYKGGFFLVLFIVSLLSFIIIVYDKLSGISSEEKKEIGVLKALGWRVEDVLYAKFYEGMIISLSAYLLGVFISLFFVYILQAPLLKNIFITNSALAPALHLPFVLDFETLFLLFLLSVPIYIAATIIPSWKIATLDADEVIR